jgi:hypothetical protein
MQNTVLIFTRIYAAAVAYTENYGSKQYQTEHTECEKVLTITTTLIRGVAAVLTPRKEVFGTDRLPNIPKPLWFHQGLPAILCTRNVDNGNHTIIINGKISALG